MKNEYNKSSINYINSLQSGTLILRHLAQQGSNEALDILIQERIIIQKQIQGIGTFSYSERQTFDKEIYKERINIETRKAKLIEAYLANTPLTQNVEQKQYTIPDIFKLIINFFMGK